MPYKTEPPRHHFSPMKTFPPPAVPALLALAVACGQDDAPVDQSIFTPDAIGTAALPLSESHQVALLADERASRA